MKNLLKGARVYLGGNMENTADCENWRNSTKRILGDMGVKCLLPTQPMFDGQPGETPEFGADLLEQRANGNLEYVKAFMETVIERDLRAVDIADFGIYNFECTKPTFGTMHEIVVSTQQKKPLFVAVGDKRKAPLWLIGLLKPSWLYSSVEEIIDTLKKIDSGEIVPDSARWRLLLPELR